MTMPRREVESRSATDGLVAQLITTTTGKSAIAPITSNVIARGGRPSASKATSAACQTPAAATT
jgi:hypothetical protein